MKKNALVAQSGGPSPVINSSLQGVIETCFNFPEHINKMYASWHGIEGVLLEELIDISIQSKHEIKLLRNTPAAGAIGSCRYKLEKNQKEDLERIVKVLQAHNIGYFFYIGGNDSMNIASRVSKLAEERGLELSVAGVPKTIDNDLGDEKFKLIDHTPGYGSTARYWAYLIQNTEEENRGMSVSEPVTVLQAMGRKAGYITAASRLADPERKIPLQLYMSESEHTLDSLAENVNKQIKKSKRCIVVVNEGFRIGDYGEAYDGFGNIEYGASRTTAAQEVVNYLNSSGLKTRGNATFQVPGVIQRDVSIYASEVDIEEAYEAGKKAVEIAVYEGTGWMATILRKPGSLYNAVYDKVKLEKIAGSSRLFPLEWISPGGTDVTDDFIKYAAPLIGEKWPGVPLENGLQRFADLKISFIDKKLEDYVPLNFRNKALQ
jgi:ATP-dependent phosphofructokinase / diphosphate-dependent phosphofructokinase